MSRIRSLVMTLVVLALVPLCLAGAPTAPAQAWGPFGCVRATDMMPSTRNLDVYVAFVPGGHRLGYYYPMIGIDAANYWYGAVHNVTLWATPDGRSQVAVNAANYGMTGWAGNVSKTSNPNLPPCTARGPFTDDTWAQWNTYYTNSYTDAMNRAIMVHELGHTMGLAHESTHGACGSVMHAQMTVNFSQCGGNPRPRWDDVFGIQALYSNRA